MESDDGDDKQQKTARHLAYTGLRLKKFARKAALDLVPPIIARRFAPNKSKVRKAGLLTNGGRPFTIEDIPPAEYAFMTSRARIELPISRMRYAGGLKFTEDQNHFVRYLSHGIIALERFYSVHQPHNILEKHFVDMPVKAGRELPLKGLPWIMYGDGLFDRQIAAEKGLSAKHGHQHHGPVSPEKIALEASHLDRLAKSFKAKGVLDVDDIPTGHFILDDETGDWAFYIKDGQHRIAVMAHLGLETAVVTTTGLAAVTSLSARHWPMVRRNILTEEEALAVLRAYTTQDGKPGIFDRN